MHIEVKDIFIFLSYLLSFFSGGGLGLLAVKLFIQNQAKAAVKDDLKRIEQNLIDLKKDVNDALKDYVDCKYCSMQHENLNVLLKSMNSKLDIIIEKY